ncbi:MAG: hypothetical protein WDM70_06510 [Nitrosomonadales bacterium]
MPITTTCPSNLMLQKSADKIGFLGEFLSALFFEAFAKPKADRTPVVQTLTGDIPISMAACSCTTRWNSMQQAAPAGYDPAHSRQCL